MSKDKGSKNKKKAKADKNSGKKSGSDYKLEGKKDRTTTEVFHPKTDDKKAGGNKKK